jgi:predicted regulator of Ras-like GTPase activity (Roadblock/LC7/MglB family)
MTVETTVHPDTFNWLLVNFVRNTDGVRDAVAVAPDGLLIASSAGLAIAESDRLAALVSGLASLSRTASHQYQFDGLKLIMIEMRRGFLLVSMIADGSCVAAIADDQCDIARVGYEISVLADRAGHLLTPT